MKYHQQVIQLDFQAIHHLLLRELFPSPLEGFVEMRMEEVFMATECLEFVFASKVIIFVKPKRHFRELNLEL